MTDIKYIRGDVTKLANKRFQKELEAVGWKAVGAAKADDAPSERDVLKETADAMGPDYPANIPTAKLKELIKEG